jgi:protease secretion system membrane fusion protein
MKLLRHHQIRAGMPAEVFVRTGERTLLSYLLKPLVDRLGRALTEP